MLRAAFVTLTAALSSLVIALPAWAADSFVFPSIDGGDYDLADWRGQPVLVVNTASLCAFTPQYDGLQALHDTYADRGLVVLAVPSDDFAQELATEDEVAEFCDLNFNLTLPMTTITRVTDPGAHPFYDWLREDHGIVPRWNFNKVLLDGAGNVVASYGSLVDPLSGRITGDIEALLAQ